MKKYKLIKEYPGSPKIGAIAKSDKIDYVYYYLEKDSHTGIGSSIIENNPEFWKEIVEKDYEILSFKIPGNAHWFANLQHNGMYGGWSEDHALNQLSKGIWSINSVKRLSDSEVFTVGDNTKYGCIDEFYIKNNHLLATTVLESSGKYLKDLQKTKQPLFTTEDGVDIFEGDEVTWLFRDELKIAGTRKANENMYTYLKYFSTKEKAEEYILLNKPCLSINDVLSVGQRVIVDEGKLKQIVKSKI